MKELSSKSDLHLCYESDYTCADVRIKNNDAKVALIEASETGANDVSYCLEICAALRKDTTSCKIILMCSDQDEEAVAQTVTAKQEGRIDDFVFYEASFDYISTKILTMLQN